MAWFDFLFGSNPSNEAQKYLNQIPGATKPYYDPYIQQGQTANKDLMEQYNKLINDPNALYNKFGQGYQQSPGYQFKLNEALRGGTNAAAAGGMAGSLAHQQAAQQTAHDISNQDFEEYLNHIMGLYGTGLQGEQGISEQGFKAGTGYADMLANLLSSQAQYGYAGKAGQNANMSSLLNNLISGGVTLGTAGLLRPKTTPST
jgi:hypothetical protein